MLLLLLLLPLLYISLFIIAAKKNVNVGKGGGTAGLDDYIYDDADEDGYDFM
jgi:hypothetical protein